MSLPHQEIAWNRFDADVEKLKGLQNFFRRLYFWA